MCVNPWDRDGEVSCPYHGNDCLVLFESTGCNQVAMIPISATNHKLLIVILLFDTALVLAEIELIFLVAAPMMLCFGFRVTMLITH